MRQTLTAVFDHRGDAQHALNKLLAAGYTQEDAALSTPASGSSGPAGRRHVVTLTTESEPETERAVGLVGRLVPDALAGAGDRSRSRSGNEADEDLKSRWALRHVGELPPWEQFKDALLHGWGRIRLGNDET